MCEFCEQSVTRKRREIHHSLGAIPEALRPAVDHLLWMYEAGHELKGVTRVTWNGHADDKGAHVTVTFRKRPAHA